MPAVANSRCAVSSSCWHSSSACSLPSTLVPVSTNWQTPAAYARSSTAWCLPAKLGLVRLTPISMSCMVLPRTKGWKAYQSCRFIRKAKSYNELKLSFDAARQAGVVSVPSLCQSFALCQRSRRSVSVVRFHGDF
ncbi:hypothetical protein EMIT0P171_190024 [Pseudomonas sp. IT-P171]